MPIGGEVFHERRSIFERVALAKLWRRLAAVAGVDQAERIGCADDNAVGGEANAVLLVGRRLALPHEARNDAEHVAAVDSQAAAADEAQLDVADREWCAHYALSRSTSIATALPPPRQRAATPIRPLRRSSACSNVTNTRAPLAPIGWPSAIAPPQTFTRSGEIPS